MEDAQNGVSKVRTSQETENEDTQNDNEELRGAVGGVVTEETSDQDQKNTSSAGSRFDLIADDHLPNGVSEVPKCTPTDNLLETMKHYKERLNSFRSWPRHHTFRSDEMAKAGYQYLGYSDCVKCVYCSVEIQFWTKSDSLLDKHHNRCIMYQNVTRGHTGQIRGASRGWMDVVKNLGYNDEQIMQAEEFLVQHDISVEGSTILEVIFGLEDGAGHDEIMQHLEDGKIQLDNVNQICIALGYEETVVQRAVSLAKEIKVAQIGDIITIVAALENEQEQQKSVNEQKCKEIENIQREVEKWRGLVNCIVCLENPRKLMFLPCGHFVTCKSCGRKVYRDSRKKCIMCRQDIKDVHVAFL